MKVRLFINEDGDDELVVSLTGGSNHPNEGEVIFRDRTGKNDLLTIGREVRLVLSKPSNIHLADNN